jgi:two-component system KDP operon response regulator KdpE
VSAAPTGQGRVLVVDDEPQLLRLVVSLLEAAGFTTITAEDGQKALELAATQNPDLILLDVMLPGPLDGMAVSRRLREFSTVPIVMLTAKAREIDEVAGFEAGADDYITKPFSAATLIARVQATLRRASAPEAQTATLTAGDVVIDLWRHEVRRDGHLVDLTPTEFKLLKELATHADRIVLHRDLLSRVWGPEYRDDVDYLRTYVRTLRRKLERDPGTPRLIVTKPGVGYMLATSEPVGRDRGRRPAPPRRS